MLTICAWCKKILSKTEEPTVGDLVSHGICEKCLREYFPEEISDEE